MTDNYLTIPKSKIIGIQFGIQSPDEIRKMSVAEITTHETYQNNIPIIGGLMDPRMGVLESGLICPTDGHDYISCPGYFGHIEMPIPIYYMHYYDDIVRYLKCYCFKCSKLLCSKQKHKAALELLPEARHKYIYTACEKIKRCGKETDDGCGFVQPSKYRKDGLATIVAEWAKKKGDTSPADELVLTPQMVLNVFKRISDEDVKWAGGHPIWAHPANMICTVLAVPPPAMRPSVKHDGQQRSEDDLTHILSQIVKTKNTLAEKIQQGASESDVKNLTTLLQYYTGTLVNNKMKDANPMAQRSGRPLKVIDDRLKGKTGRMRGNLMAKRVDYSARSVITAEPNISIQELGIPKKVALNVTKPVVVNRQNLAFLSKLVQNGPDVYPGAKVLVRKSGHTIPLRYADRSSIVLEVGDKVHRHMMNGDMILFNRQPTLHKMSMMGHIVRVMEQGDTFRMNVADTKPYNADYDGDEMNMHMPQDIEAEMELKYLAAVPFQLISPGNHAPIIGIYQDNMIGAYQFTRAGVKFNPKEAMNLLMSAKHVAVENLRKSSITNFDVLTQILPPLSLYQKNKKFDNDNKATTNNIVEIKNGTYVRGQLDKGIIGSATKGLIHRICNDFGNYAASNFIDNLQSIINEYLLHEGFSVGILDLMSTEQTKKEISNIITTKKAEVKNLLEQVQLGIMENTSGRTNYEELESRANAILNQAVAESGKASIKTLDILNQFIALVISGSKGSELNISQMISCLGQQNLEGKRIPYGFEHRTLPHFTKFDDSPSARGFVENSYVNGLTATEFFFHAEGGREGLIDTAVKTSKTGYIQRQLVKSLEDCKVEYDMTVRNARGKIVEFRYGDDGIDATKIESQDLGLVEMSVSEIYGIHGVPEGAAKIYSNVFVKSAAQRIKKQTDAFLAKAKTYTDYLINMRGLIVQNVFNNKSDRNVRAPVAFAFIIDNIMGQQNLNANSLVDITFLETYELLEDLYEDLSHNTYTAPTELFKTLFWYYLSPVDLLVRKRFNEKALKILVETIKMTYFEAIISSGEMAGILAAQSIGEPSTQMTLNTFHAAGVASKSNVTRGVPRLEEILALSPNIKNPSLTIDLKPEKESDKDLAIGAMHMMEYTTLQDIVNAAHICFDPDDLNTLVESDRNLIEQYRAVEALMGECGAIEEEGATEKSKWVLRLELSPEAMLDHNLTMNDVHFAIKNGYGDTVHCMFSDYNSDQLIFRIRLDVNAKANKPTTLDQTDQIYLLKQFQTKLLETTILRGVSGITNIVLRKTKDSLTEVSGTFKRQEAWVLDTTGSNLMDVLGLDYIDQTRTFTNDIIETFQVLGIEAARQCIYNEFADVIEGSASYISYRHLNLLANRISHSHKLIAVSRHGINNDNIGPIAKASFEETTEIFMNAGKFAELDNLRGVSSNVMCGQEGTYGTNSFEVVLDINKFMELDERMKIERREAGVMDDLERELMGAEGGAAEGDKCSIARLVVDNNVANLKQEDMGKLDDNYNPFE